MPKIPQPVTDNSVKVRQLSHYQFSWIAGQPGQPGTYTVQLVLEQGAWEEILTLDPDDAEDLQDLLENTDTVHDDIERRVLMFGVTPRQLTSLRILVPGRPVDRRPTGGGPRPIRDGAQAAADSCTPPSRRLHNRSMSRL